MNDLKETLGKCGIVPHLILQTSRKLVNGNFAKTEDPEWIGEAI